METRTIFGNRPPHHLGGISPVTHHGSRVTGFGYDNANRLLSIDRVKTPTTVGAPTYLYDSAGNRTGPMRNIEQTSPGENRILAP